MNRLILGIFSFFALILTVSAMNYNMPADNNTSGSSSELKQNVSFENSCQKQCCYNKSK